MEAETAENCKDCGITKPQSDFYSSTEVRGAETVMGKPEDKLEDVELARFMREEDECCHVHVVAIK
jgi:hypothetical protein